MGSIHRILWFDQNVRQYTYPNCKQLAEKFEISLRQANRDIDYLKNTLNAPLKYLAAKRGFIYEDEAFVLPNIYITEEEKKALGFLAFKYENYDGTQKNAKVAELFKKLSGQTSAEDKIPVFSLHTHGLKCISTLNELIAHQRKAYLQYNWPGRGMLKLLIHPYDIFGKLNADYLVAFCEDYGEVLEFRLERIEDITVSNEKFVINPAAKSEIIKRNLTKMPYKAVLALNNGLLQNHFFGRNITYKSKDQIEIEFFDIEGLIKDLLGSNVWKEILFPEWLKEKLRNRCTDIIKKLE